MQYTNTFPYSSHFYSLLLTLYLLALVSLLFSALRSSSKQNIRYQPHIYTRFTPPGFSKSQQTWEIVGFVKR